MQGVLYEESSVWLFLLVTIMLGGGAAWLTGQASARSWSSFLMLIVYLLLLGWAVRFIHHALFEGTFLSLHYYIVDTLVLLVIGALGFRYTRAQQMVSQYYWIYERSGPLGWRRRPEGAPSST